MDDSGQGLKQYVAKNGPRDRWGLMTGLGTEGQVTTFFVVELEGDGTDYEVWETEITCLRAIDKSRCRWYLEGTILASRPNGSPEARKTACEGSCFRGNLDIGPPFYRGEFEATLNFAG